MTLRSSALGLSAALFLSGLPAWGLPQAGDFLAVHCSACHGGDKARGDFALSELEGPDAARRLQDVLDMLAWGEMPPAGEPAPDGPSSDRFQQELRARLTALGANTEAPPAAPRAVRRLGHREYRNAILDVLGVDYDVAALLPPDEVSQGFDVVAEALVLTPTHLERYLSAAEAIATQAVRLPEELGKQSRVYGARDLNLTQREFAIRPDPDGREWICFHSNGGAQGEFSAPLEGTYVLHFLVSADQAGPDLAAFDVRVNEERVARLEVTCKRPEPLELTQEVRLKAGNHRIAAAFINDYFRPEAKIGQRDRNFYLAEIEVEGPLEQQGPRPFQTRWLREGEKLEESLAQLAAQLFRRPVQAREMKPYLKLTRKEDSVELRLRTALTAMLVSPNFLVTGTEPEGYRTAAAMAWFVGRSTPDGVLLAAARDGELDSPAGRARQALRLLRGPRATSLAEDFAQQWLQLGRLSEMVPDPLRFAAFDDGLRAAMRAETLLCFEAVLREQRPVRELLDADWTFVNERLAKHYGFAGVQGEHMRRIAIPADQRTRRGGLLGQAGLLCVTSNPTRTSPVKRGKWILEALLDSAPPPPPPGVGTLEQAGPADAQLSLVERLALHRADAQCAACHDTMDALGLGLENFDAIGRWRDSDGPFAIQATATLPDGRSFSDPA
ncbi:MAG: DUF1592 domain-containing protein, partial [Planctomycetota bacterium]